MGKKQELSYEKQGDWGTARISSSVEVPVWRRTSCYAASNGRPTVHPDVGSQPRSGRFAQKLELERGNRRTGSSTVTVLVRWNQCDEKNRVQSRARKGRPSKCGLSCSPPRHQVNKNWNSELTNEVIYHPPATTSVQQCNPGVKHRVGSASAAPTHSSTFKWSDCLPRRCSQMRARNRVKAGRTVDTDQYMRSCAVRVA